MRRIFTSDSCHKRGAVGTMPCLTAEAKWSRDVSKTGLKLCSPRCAEYRACDSSATSAPYSESWGGW